MDSLRTNIDLQTLRLTGEGEENSSTGAATVVGFMAAFIMYLFIFLYGSMVVRGVVEEKASRVMEVLVASVRPFDLMLGKILGIAAVGLAQFVVWTALTSGLVALAQATILGGTEATSAQMAGSSPDGFEGIMLGLGTLNLPFLLSMFLFYFISGYLLYAALFAKQCCLLDDLYQKGYRSYSTSNSVPAQILNLRLKLKPMGKTLKVNCHPFVAHPFVAN